MKLKRPGPVLLLWLSLPYKLLFGRRHSRFGPGLKHTLYYLALKVWLFFYDRDKVKYLITKFKRRIS